jgi:hypothetical protein
MPAIVPAAFVCSNSELFATSTLCNEADGPPFDRRLLMLFPVARRRSGRDDTECSHDLPALQSELVLEPAGGV